MTLLILSDKKDRLEKIFSFLGVSFFPTEKRKNWGIPPTPKVTNFVFTHTPCFPMRVLSRSSNGSVVDGPLRDAMFTGIASHGNPVGGLHELQDAIFEIEGHVVITLVFKIPRRSDVTVIHAQALDETVRYNCPIFKTIICTE